MGLLFLNQNAGTSNYRIFSGVKLNHVQMWAVAGTGANDYGTTTCSVFWSSNYGPTNEVSDSGNAFRTATVTTSPPKQSLASFWSLAGSNETEVLCTITCPIGTIIDINVDLVLEDGETPVSITSTQTGVLGQLYAGYLDFAAGAGAPALQPVSLGALF